MAAHDGTADTEQLTHGGTAPPHPTVAGIGTSAGGLTALKAFFENVPANSGVAYVIVTHLSPEHQSHLAELLQPHVRMPVQQVTETVMLEGDRVFVIPPKANLESVDTHLRLSGMEANPRQRAPIDHFFRTLSRTHGGHAIGVILTGTGSDGTLGLKQIKEKGGLTIVQDPQDAEYDGMPQSAIAGGLVDLVLPLSEIPAAVIRFARTQPKIDVQRDGEAVEEDGRLLLQKVFAQLRARTGRDFSGYKRSTILRRIAGRMQLAQIEEFSRYLQLLRERPEETVAVADDLLITVSSFFRDAEVFEQLANVIIPRLFEGKSVGDELRVWSAGCATGEEAYSLAMLLVEEAGRREDVPHIQVFATDLHEPSLIKGREGVYPGDITSDLTPERLRRFFIREDGGYRIRQEVREHVVFAQHNLLGDPPFSRLDLICCRNLLIYLERNLQRDVIEIFHYALRPNGVLVLGPSETLDAPDLFHVELKKQCVFRKRNVPAPEPRLPVFPLTRARSLRGLSRQEQGPEPIALGELHHRLVERFAPPSLLVSADDRVVHLSERAGRYLVHPGGELTASVYKLVREELRIDLRAALHEAREHGTDLRIEPVPVNLEGEVVHVGLHVHPASNAADRGFALVIFNEVHADAAPSLLKAARDAGEGSPARTREITAERDLARQRLQKLIEEYETSQEEMRASNEELQSTNEELRSTLEEIETSKEELQSVNEELQTVNQENRHKVEELAQLTSDLQNLLAATDIATLFLDRELRILRFTPKVGELFHIRSTDRGRPLSDLAHRLAETELLNDAARVLERLIPVEREVQAQEGRWYVARVLPYRSADDRIEGVVVTFVDITTVKQSEEALRDLNETLEARVEERTLQVRQLAASLTMAEQEERRRISQILHDDLQQLLYGIQMKLAHAREFSGDGDLGRILAQVDRSIELLDSAVARTRQLTVDLSPPVLQGDGLLEALEWIRTQMRDLHGLDVTIRANGPIAVHSRELRVLLFQTVRELLFNVTKHADAERAELEVEQRDGVLTITVSDSGRGFDLDELKWGEDGWGLFSVRERLRLQGGDVDVASRAGRGTRVVIQAPITPSASAERRSGSDR